MVTFIFSSLNVLFSLLLRITTRSFFFSQLSNHICLMFNFLLQCADLLIFVCSVLFSGGQAALKGSNFLFQLRYSCISFGHLLFQCIFLLLLRSNSFVNFIQLLLHICSHSLNASCLVNNILNSRASRFKSKRNVILLTFKGVMHSLDLFTCSKGLINIGLSKSNFVLKLFFVLGKLSTLQSWLDSQPNLHPWPRFCHHEI